MAGREQRQVAVQSLAAVEVALTASAPPGSVVLSGTGRVEGNVVLRLSQFLEPGEGGGFHFENAPARIAGILVLCDSYEAVSLDMASGRPVRLTGPLFLGEDLLAALDLLPMKPIAIQNTGEVPLRVEFFVLGASD